MMIVGTDPFALSASTVSAPVENVIVKKAALNSRSIRILFLTSNELKVREYKDFLKKTYGVDITNRKPPEEMTQELAKKILAEADPSPHYILREETHLINALNKKPVSGLDIVEHPESAPRFLYNAASLHVWIPKWNKESVLQDIEEEHYEHRVEGYINPAFKDRRNPDVIGWDHLFVNPKTGRTHLDNSSSSWGKNSARQLVLSDFVTAHLFYKKPQALMHHTDLKPEQGIEFSQEMSVDRFMQNNQYLSNPHLNVWGLKALMTNILDEGVFFKSATSRPIKNYFSPPFGGIPLTAKKSDVEETIFMMHDLNHHNIPDLIFNGDDSIEMRNVYVAWRMMSEAMTLVIADMFYADTVVRSNPENEKSVDTRIYPLFKALDIEEVTEDNRQQIMIKLLWANTQYAVLGNDLEWKKLLRKGEESKLEAYKNHFGKFFIGDHVWSHANFENMASLKDSYKEWVDLIGEDLLKKANLFLLKDVVKSLKKQGVNLLSLKDTVTYVFMEILLLRIFPKDSASSIEVGTEERLSRAFRRYMIGQLSFYFRYKELPDMLKKAEALRQKIEERNFINSKDREEIYRQYTNDVRYVWGMGCITTATADNFCQVHPIFPPVYINYFNQECKTVEEVVSKLYGKD